MDCRSSADPRKYFREDILGDRRLRHLEGGVTTAFHLLRADFDQVHQQTAKRPVLDLR